MSFKATSLIYREGCKREVTKAAPMTKQEEVLIKALISMIQADGKIEPRETKILGEVLGQLDLPLEDIATAGKWIMNPQQFDKSALKDGFTTQQDLKAVKDIFQEVVKSDGALDENEVKLLQEFSDTLASF